MDRNIQAQLSLLSWLREEIEELEIAILTQDSASIANETLDVLGLTLIITENWAEQRNYLIGELVHIWSQKQASRGRPPLHLMVPTIRVMMEERLRNLFHPPSSPHPKKKDCL
jgi:NTP pyrophosphatase (non-canonical NTP hydrolase)